MTASEEETVSILDPEKRKENPSAEYASHNDFSVIEEVKKAPWFFLLVALIALDEGLQAFANLAISYFYKDHLHVGPALVSLASGILLVPWAVKPVWGLIVDMTTIKKSHFLFVFSTLSGACWCILASKAAVNSFWATVAWLLVKSVAFAFLSVITKGLLVEHSGGRSQRFASFLQALFFGMASFGGLIGAYCGGFALDYISPRTVFGLSAIFPFLVSLVTIALPDRAPPPPPVSMRDQLARVWRVLVAPQTTRDGKRFALWMPLLFMLVWRSTPSPSSAMFYFFTNDLHFSKEFMGRLGLVGAAATLLAMLLYQRFLSEKSFNAIIIGGGLTVAALSASMIALATHQNRVWGMDDGWFAMGSEAIVDAVATVAFLPILTLAALLCPRGIEATLFALLMAALNLGQMISMETGGLLMHALGITEHDFSRLWLLLTLCCALSVLPLALIPFLLPSISKANYSVEENLAQPPPEEQQPLPADQQHHQQQQSQPEEAAAPSSLQHLPPSDRPT